MEGHDFSHRLFVRLGTGWAARWGCYWLCWITALAERLNQSHFKIGIEEPRLSLAVPLYRPFVRGDKKPLKTRDSAPSDTSGWLVKTAVAAHVILRFIFPAGLKDRVSALHFPPERAFCTCDRPVPPFARGSQWGDRGSRRPCTTRPCMSDWLVLTAVAAHQTLRSCFPQNSDNEQGLLHPARRLSLNFEHLLT